MLLSFKLACPNFVKNFFAGVVLKKTNIDLYATSTRPIGFGIVEVFAKARVFHAPIYVVYVSDRSLAG